MYTVFNVRHTEEGPCVREDFWGDSWISLHVSNIALRLHLSCKAVHSTVKLGLGEIETYCQDLDSFQQTMLVNPINCSTFVLVLQMCKPQKIILVQI